MTGNVAAESQSVQALINWYQVNQRDLPWRRTKDPYKIWISEIMLQQTQVQTVIAYYNRFIKKLPTVIDLANAEIETILKLWEGLGYYQRARNMHKAAKIIVERHHGQLPKTYDELQALPGLGAYCAAAVASIAYAVPVPVVDGNVLRVFARVWGIKSDIRKNETKAALFNRLSKIIKGENPSDFNQAMMELGALICSKTQPQCGQCPMQSGCFAHKNNKTTELPYKSQSAKTPHQDLGVAVVSNRGRVLLVQRKTALLQGLWELPALPPHTSESYSKAAIRAAQELAGYHIKVRSELPIVKHSFTHLKMTLHPFCCLLSNSHPSEKKAGCRWASKSDWQNLALTTAARKVLKSIQKRNID